MKYSGAEIIIKCLELAGINTVAGIPGGANLPLYDALSRSRIRHVLARHEQGAGFIAQGLARAAGGPAVCFATSGPGAMNLLTAIADARRDSIPIVAVTGQVNLSLMGTDAFQEIDILKLARPITKRSFLVRSACELPFVMSEAFAAAVSGRPGPVLVDVPRDVQVQKTEIPSWPDFTRVPPLPVLDLEALSRIAGRIGRAEKPLLYIGGGTISSGASRGVRELSLRNGIPVTSTLMGLGAFPSDDPLYMGMIGMHGTACTNRLLDEVDLLVAVGVRFDDRAIGLAAEFCKHADIVHIDIDRSVINKIKKANISLTADAGQALDALIPLVEENSRGDWTARAGFLKSLYEPQPPDPEDLEHPVSLIRFISSRLGDDAIVCTDVGQHQMWVAQHFPFRRPRSLLTSGGLGTMGFGLPAAIGAALGCPGRRVVCFSGDGSILMNIQELATLSDLGLDVTVVVMNNRQLGLVRQQQELFFGGNYFASRFESSSDFAGIGRGFGLRSVDLAGERDVRAALARALDVPGPCLVNAPIHGHENVYPMVPPGMANREMIGSAGEKERG